MHLTVTRTRVPRSVWEHALRLVLLRTTSIALLVGAVLCGQALAMQPQSSAFLESTDAGPVWTTALAAENPGCLAAEDWPPHTWGSAVIAVPVAGGDVARVGFDEAWERSHNLVAADDLVILGICAT